MIPASLRSAAGTTRQRVVRRGMNLSAFLLTPPPRIMRLGHISLSIRSRCSSRSAAQAFHDRPRLTRAAAADRRSASRPRISMWPNSVLGTSLPVDEHPRTDPRPEGEEDDDPRLIASHAEAHLGEACGVGVVDDRDRPGERPGQPVDLGEVDPGRVDVGGGLERRRRWSPPAARHRPASIVPSPLARASRLTSRTIEALTASGVDGHRCRHADPLRSEPAGLDVDDGALDPAAADVDADGDPTAGHQAFLVADVRGAHRSGVRS